MDIKMVEEIDGKYKHTMLHGIEQTVKEDVNNLFVSISGMGTIHNVHEIARHTLQVHLDMVLVPNTTKDYYRAMIKEIESRT